MKYRQLTTVEAKRGAMSPMQWTQLLRKALTRAELIGDPRVVALQAAMTGNAEQTLRRLSVICEADLDREFPLPTT